MKRLLLLLLLLSNFCRPVLAAAEAMRPNILWIVGENIANGLKNDIFAKGKARVRVFASNEKMVSEILLFTDPK